MMQRVSREFCFIVSKMRNLRQRYLIRIAFNLLVTFLLHQEVTSNSVGDLSEDQSRIRCFLSNYKEYGRDCQEVQTYCSTANTSGVYFIKPDGYFKPFEVFCDNSDGFSGWTVIERRTDGSINFKRNWTEYQAGFGFPSGEFWLGSDKLSYLTNQKTYELQIDIVNAEGSSYYVKYNSFRISDNQGEYKLTSLGNYSGNADELIAVCPLNMLHNYCDCQATCNDPTGCHKNCVDGEETCICTDGYLLNMDNNCVLQQECGCFVDGYGVVPNGGKYVNSNCTRECSCNDNLLTCDEHFQCSSNATCQESGDTHQCRCKDAFEGNGQTCVALPTDCMELYNAGNTTNGVYTIYPESWSGSKFDVYCDMTTDGGGWTVFQRRMDGSVNFYQNWTSYKLGFGDQTGEHWLGNDKIHFLTNSRIYQLRVELVDNRDKPYFALYDLFRVNDEDDKYRLVGLGSFSGTAGHNSMVSSHNRFFTTFDRDNGVSRFNAAVKQKGAWWYRYTIRYDTHRCHTWQETGSLYYYSCSLANLNGNYSGGKFNSVFWYGLRGNDCNIRQTEMKIRPM